MKTTKDDFKIFRVLTENMFFFLGGMGQRMPEIYKNIIGALQNISIPLLTISESLIESNEKEIHKVMAENTR